MKRAQKAVSLGDLVVAAYDAADRMSKDAESASVLAACAVRKLLLKAGRRDLAQQLSELKLNARPVAA